MTTSTYGIPFIFTIFPGVSNFLKFVTEFLTNVIFSPEFSYSSRSPTSKHEQPLVSGKEILKKIIKGGRKSEFRKQGFIRDVQNYGKN